MAVTASEVRYIKLGKGGAWERASLDNDELHFGFQDAPHDVSLTRDYEKIRQSLITRGRLERVASSDAREVLEFYSLDEKCLWVTFAREHMWWCFADPHVSWRGGDGMTGGERVRKVIGKWRNTDVRGQPLKISTLSTKITKVAGYRRTICKIEAKDYLLRRINGLEEPIVAKGVQARQAILDATKEALQLLHWKDFETLVDVIFARSGWNRISALGGNQKLVDLELEQSVTNERMAVQVKSEASQAVLDQYIERIDEAGQFQRFVFICHSRKGALVAPPGRSNIQVWTDQELAEAVFRTGLYDWVLEKC